MKIKNVFDLIFSMENLYGALEDASDQRRYKELAMIKEAADLQKGLEE